MVYKEAGLAVSINQVSGSAEDNTYLDLFVYCTIFKVILCWKYGKVLVYWKRESNHWTNLNLFLIHLAITGTLNCLWNSQTHALQGDQEGSKSGLFIFFQPLVKQFSVRLLSWSSDHVLTPTVSLVHRLVQEVCSKVSEILKKTFKTKLTALK